MKFLLRSIFAIAAFGWNATTPVTWAEELDQPEYTAPVPGTYSLPVIKKAGDGSLLEPDGRAVSLRELTHGKITVLSFIYTRCAAAKACPMATGVLRDLHRLSSGDVSLAEHLRLVSLSFDPTHDSPKIMQAYAALAEGVDHAAEWKFVTAPSPEALQPILAAYGQAVDRKKNPADPSGPLNHTLRVYLIDTVGQLRNIYSSGTLDLRLVLADIKTLILER